MPVCGTAFRRELDGTYTMGHDFIWYRDRHVHLDDMTIWTIRHFCLAAIDAIRSEENAQIAELEAIDAYFRGWQWIGPGVYLGTKADDFIGTNVERAILVKGVVHRAELIVQGFGAAIPLDYLRQHINRQDAYYTEPQPARFIIEGLRQLESMFT